MQAIAYVDADWSVTNSTAGWAIWVGGAPVIYASKKEKCVALSSTESEIVAASMATCDVLYLRMVTEFMGFPQHGATPLYIDNKGVGDIARDPISTTALKHVKRRHFFVREIQDSGEITVMSVESNHNLSDILTKEMKPARYSEMSRRLFKGPFEA